MTNVKPIGGTFEDVSEAIVKPVRDEVGQAIEVGVQSILGSSQYKSLTPQQDAQKKADEQRKLQDEQSKKQNVLRFLDQYKQQEAQLKQKRYSQEQIKSQDKQGEEQQKQQQYVVKENKKQQQVKGTIERSQAERKVGKGVGG